MSKKQEAEQRKRDEHKAQMQAAKERRRQAPALQRAAPTREERPVLLIVCQGTVTEVEYFNQFELATADIKALGRAYDPEKLVQEALDWREAARRGKQPYEQVWCVFDKDDTEPGPFHAAIERARAHGLRVAYSNQAFEFWFLLHFDEHQGGGMDRQQCGQRVEALIREANPRVSYDSHKGKHVSRELFDLLEGPYPGLPGRPSRRAVAVRRAKRIAKDWAESGHPPAAQESTTLVYQLVEVLQQYLP
ncbi:RloB domain-containing protein [Hymenobacter gummosus]|uniref:RloB domain-containing protein n=1 Tax=Hymenobacter gummosus TaxID=1776032 RepID=A0A3S0JE52_9BACT|nr:RloB family protein [Hymenobacter gummosus]RTQ49715.1 RloB domain-containing protein [Hymenobacter gummosus]